MQEKLDKLNKALAVATSLVADTTSRWENHCEDAFSKFRLTCVHLSRERAALDTVEDKQGAWRFIVKFGKTRPFLHDRCNEVLRILMVSDLWMQAFRESGLNPDDVPPGSAPEFDKRYREANPEAAPLPPRPPAEPTAGPSRRGGSAEPPVTTALRPANMAVVVQRCTTAKVLVDERMQMWGEIGRGLVVSVSFSRGAKVDAVHSAARFLLTAQLSAGSDGRRPDNSGAGGAESVVSLCKRGEKQGVLLLPQASLCSSLTKDNIGLEYSHACPASAAEELYKAFTESLRTMGAELIGTGAELRVVASSFTGRQTMEMTSNGPFMHAFNF